MIEMTLGEIAATLAGELHVREGESAQTVIRGVSDTDSRKIKPGDIFFAKPGEVTDGHLFADDAATNGAALIVAQRRVAAAVSQIIVPDTVAALGQLACEVVARVRSAGRLRVIGVTGSNGKTTTKNLLREIFSRRYSVVAPIGSYNNEVGAPTTFLRVTPETEVLVAEMGASHIGDIREIAAMAPPDIGVVLMVGLAHAGEFGGIDNVATAKREMVQAIQDGGVAVLNADDPRVVAMAQDAPGRVVWFGRGKGAQVRADDVSVSLAGTEFTLTVPGEQPERVLFPVIGEHHVMNALAAASCAHVAGISVAEVAEVLRGIPMAERGRMQVLTDGPVTVINDAYNANPNSMAAALRTLAQLAEGQRRAVAVLGAMSELGEYSTAEQDRLGELAVRLGIDRIVVVGDQARQLYLAAVAQGSWDNEASFVKDAGEAFELVSSQLQPGDIVLVKSSNSAGLLKLADELGDYVKGQYS